MIVPNKLFSLSESVLGKVPLIKKMEHDEYPIATFVGELRTHLQDIEEVIHLIELFYLLDLIQVDFSRGVITDVKRNTL